MKAKLYLETTIPSYLISRPSRDLIVAAHQQITRDWWEKRRLDFEIFISQFVLDEAGQGDEEASQKRLETLSEFNILDITDEVTNLTAEILLSGIIPQKSATDAAHIAIATIHKMNFLLTWNCAHLANAEIWIAIYSVCGSKGYECPIICTPEELMGED
ncbi:MAG: type II toxin-antitoxin system VapC family toxin [Candidatus Eremiobacteraeota bacterium]|nr:type II toxin-antitoxin system VapC family toxin [Candidatus Eremiobacteraeota bacterium]